MSLALALVLGTAGLPHVLTRFYTVPTGQRGAPVGGLDDLADRIFYLFTLVLGYGAAALVAQGTLTAANQNNAAPLLAFQLGGGLLLGLSPRSPSRRSSPSWPV